MRGKGSYGGKPCHRPPSQPARVVLATGSGSGTAMGGIQGGGAARVAPPESPQQATRADRATMHKLVKILESSTNTLDLPPKILS
jgi:hypothetical protein